MDKPIITIEDVSLILSEEVILDKINICFEKEKIYGLIGRNGSGKTVLMKCICGFFKPNSGSITVQQKVVGKDIDFPQNIGILIENPGFLGNFSGMENLKMLALIKRKIDKADIVKAVQQVGLNPKLRKNVSKYSLGMKQRLGIAQAIMENPDILLLDEPMNGLDSTAVNDIRELILHMKKEGKTIILSSHDAEDIKILCDETFFLENGKLIV